MDYKSYISYEGDFDYYKVKLHARDYAGMLNIKIDLPFYKTDSSIGDMYYAYYVYVYDSDKKDVAVRYGFLYTDDNDSKNLFSTKPSLEVVIKPEHDTYYILVVGAAQVVEGNYYNTSNPDKPYLLRINTSADYLSDVKVYPNPFKPGDSDDSTGITYSEDLYNSGIIFQGMANDTRLKIYDLSGRLILDKNLPKKGWFQWDTKDSQNQEVTSGVYIYVLTDSAGRVKKGKFSIIR